MFHPGAPTPAIHPLFPRSESMKIVPSGLQPDFDVGASQHRTLHVGPVPGVPPVREEGPDQPWSVVAMNLGVGEDHEVVRRIDGTCRVDRFIHARVLVHG